MTANTEHGAVGYSQELDEEPGISWHRCHRITAGAHARVGRTVHVLFTRVVFLKGGTKGNPPTSPGE